MTKVNIRGNFYGSFIEDWIFAIMKLPSKLKTAIPKKRGRFEGVRMFKSETNPDGFY